MIRPGCKLIFVQRLGSSAGYEIARDGDVVWMAHRGTRGPLLVALIAGGLALAAAVNGAIWTTKLIGDGETRSGLVLAAVLIGVTGLLAAVSTLGFRGYRRRRRAPLVEMATLRADLAAGQLQTPGGAVIAALTEVEVDTPRNLGDSTQGSMRWVRLRWPKGSARVYSAASSEAQRVAGALVDVGIGRSAD